MGNIMEGKLYIFLPIFYMIYIYDCLKYICYMVIKLYTRCYTFTYVSLNSYSRSTVLCGCVSPHMYCASSIGIHCSSNDICYMLILYYWYRVCAECGCSLSFGCVSPKCHSALHGCNFLVYMVVMLCYADALRLVFIAFNSCILYMSVLIFSCDECVIECYSELVIDESLPVIGAFRPIIGDTTLRYEIIYHTKWLQEIN